MTEQAVEREATARIIKGARLSAPFGREFCAGDGRLDDVDLDAADAILALRAPELPAQGEGLWRVSELTPTTIVTPQGRISIGWAINGDTTRAEQTAAMIVRLVNAALQPVAERRSEPQGDVVLVPQWLIRFLRGEDHWPGHPKVHFGDAHPTERGAFFWRRHLPSVPLHPAEPCAEEGGA
jgi:hypothetical protein